MSEWESVIGLEIHAQLATKSKIFSGASTAFGAEPNTQACAVDLGMPGVLPVLNREAVSMAIRFGVAIEAEMTNDGGKRGGGINSYKRALSVPLTAIQCATGSEIDV